ncbi:MAG: TonB-dependent receptor, partial [Gammaproteobacteria bacterium]
MAFRSGDLSAATSMIYDPILGNPDGTGRPAFPNKQIPDSRISPLAKKILALIPPPTSSGLTSNYEANTVRVKDSNGFDVKIDHKLREFDTMSFRYTFQRPRTFDPSLYGISGGPKAGGFAGEGIQRAQNGALNYTHIFSPRFISDFRFGVMRYRNDAKNEDSGTNASDALGIKGVNLDWFTSGLTGINIDNFSNPVIGFSASLPWIRAETNFNVVSNWTFIKGNHTLKWGGDVRRNRDDLLQTQTFSPRGLWTFTAGPTARNGDATTSFGNSFASFLLDLPNLYGRDLPGIFPTFRQTQLFTYFQDKWQINPKLTVDLGLRHEIYFAPTAAVPAGFSNYNPDTNNLELSGLGSIPADLGAGTQYRNFAPRFGIAYRLTERTVLRGGFGITVDPGYPDDKWAYNYPVKQNNAFNAINTFSAAGSMAAGFPAPLPTTIPANGIIANAPAQNYLVLPTPLRQGYVQSWNLAVQHALPWNFSFEAAYVGNHAIGVLNQQNINAGQIPGRGRDGQPLFVKFGRTQTTTTWARTGAIYHGLQAKFDRRFTGGFALTTAYTFSKAINFADDNGGLGIPIDYRMNRGRAGFDRTHMYVQSFIYDLPVGNGKRWLHSGPAAWILGNWQLAGVLSGYAGTPMTFGYSATTLNAPGNGQRANVSQLPEIFGNIGATQKWFDVSVFSVPASATFGNGGRNILSGPGLINLDMSIFKRFAISEQIQLEVRMESFNFTNTPHFNNPGSTLGGAG